MDRRKFLSVTSASLAAAGIPGSSKAEAKEARAEDSTQHFIEEKTGKNPFRVSRGPGKLPNIFVITMDMVSPDFYQPSRPLSRELHLPTLHGLMNDGVFFRNAFDTVPLCAPSRASSKCTTCTSGASRATTGHSRRTWS